MVAIDNEMRALVLRLYGKEELGRTQLFAKAFPEIYKAYFSAVAVHSL